MKSSAVRLCLATLLFTIVNGQFDPSTCGKTKTCVFHPSGCESMISTCVQGMSFAPNKYDPDSLDVEQFANNFTTTMGVYMAVAFKPNCGDVCMANTSVIECSNLEDEFGDYLQGRVSWNNDDPSNTRIDGESDFRFNIINNFASGLSGGELWCSYTQKVRDHGIKEPKVFTVHDNTQYNILMAAGPTSFGVLKHHYPGKAFVSSSKYSLLKENKRECPCNYNTIWNDIVLVIDGSDGIDQDTFSALTSYVKSNLSQLNIGQSTTSQSRVGIVVFGDSAKVEAKLSTFSSTTDFTSRLLTRSQGSPNLKSGVDAAITMFNDQSQHRSGARKVLIIVGQDTTPGSYANAMDSLHDFQNNQGIVIGLSSKHSDGMLNLSSIGYYYSKDQNSPTLFLDMLCDANCFCPPGYIPFIQSSSPRAVPNEGCYQIPQSTQKQLDAKKTCASLQNGYLAVAETRDVQTVLTNLLPRNTSILVGLERTNGVWYWNDGYLYSSATQSISGSGDCATLTHPSGFRMDFEADDCATVRNFACQATPCSSETSCL